MTESVSAVDPVVIETLREVMEDNFTLLLNTFLTDSAARISALQAQCNDRSAHSADRADSVRQLAHSLKGSCANLGAQQLVQHCQDLEHKAGLGQLEDIAANVGAIAAEFARVRTELQRFLAGA